MFWEQNFFRDSFEIIYMKNGNSFKVTNYIPFFRIRKSL